MMLTYLLYYQIIFILNEKLSNSNNNRSNPKFLRLLWDIVVFKLVCCIWSVKTYDFYTKCFTSIYKFGLFVSLFVCLFVCLSVCLYPINVKTAEPIGPKFFVWPHGAPGKVYEWSKFQIFVSIKIRSSLNFFKILKIHEFFCENPRNIVIFFRCTQRDHVHN